ncbi:MAG: BON domain-containing protein [Chloroflexi bacterium]|nr:BON domain-containing protein [Chloroflexota bacterium]
MTSRFGQGYGGMGYGPMGFGGMGFGSQSSGPGMNQFCPTCGFQGSYPMMGMPQFAGGMMPSFGFPGYYPWQGFPGSMPGYPTFTQGYPGYPQGYFPGYQTMTVPDDEQIREMIYDSIDADPLVPYDCDVSVEVTGGLVTLTGSLPNKRVKHAIGDDAWWIPGVWDVNNQIEIAGRARGKAERPTTRTTRRTTERTTETPTGRTPTTPPGTKSTTRTRRPGGQG